LDSDADVIDIPGFQKDLLCNPLKTGTFKKTEA